LDPGELEWASRRFERPLGGDSRPMGKHLVVNGAPEQPSR